MTRAQALMDRAITATGLADFGEESFREGLERLIASADAQAGFTAAGAAMFDAQIVDHLANRLQVEDWFLRHPEMDEQQIIAPLIGLGLPRTGSTALAAMLGEDPAVRCIRNWEATAPCPPPEYATQTTDPRIARAVESFARRDQMFPRMRQMVPSSATGPTECQTFMAQDFRSQLFQAFAHIPDYIHWLNHDADLVPTYNHVKRILKLLQWRCPAIPGEPVRWRLKNPSHSLFIDALDKVFPDARFYMTHRAVAQVLPSVADLYFELSRVFSDVVDQHWLGAMTSDFCALGMERMIAFRARANNEARFFDVRFADFQRDPLEQISALYRWLGEPLRDVARANMAAWRASNAREKHGKHRVNPADFGLDRPESASRFVAYEQRFLGIA